MSTAKTVEQNNSEYHKGRNMAMTFAALVYVGGVAVVTLMFISFVLLAFPDGAYIAKGIMTIGGALIGCSMLAFPWALHKWTVERTHRAVTIALYFIELGIVALNTVTAFISLMAAFGKMGYTEPAWVQWYTPFSIAAIVYTIAAWGIIFLLDPAHKRRAKDLQNQEEFENMVAEQEKAFLHSIEGEDVVMAVAAQKVQEKYNVGRYTPGTRHWGSGRTRVEEKLPKAIPGGETPALPGMDPATLMALQLKQSDPDNYGEIPLDKLREMVAVQLKNMPYPVEIKDPTQRR